MAGGRPRAIDHKEARRLRREEGLSYPEIGRLLGCHHTTAMYACNAGYRKRKNKASRDASKEQRGTA